MSDTQTVGLDEEQSHIYKFGLAMGRVEGLMQAAKALREGADKFEQAGFDSIPKEKAKTKAAATQRQAVKQVVAGIRGWAAEMETQANAARINGIALVNELAKVRSKQTFAARAGEKAGKVVARAVSKFMPRSEEHTSEL